MASKNILLNNNIDGGILMKLYLDSIAEYFKGTVRPLREEENIVDAGLIYLLDVAPLPAKNRVLGYVIQTSEMTKKPHKVKLDNLLSQVSEWICTCSCKVGIGEKCKHIAACLIFIHRNPILYPLSCTDLRQNLGKIGKWIASAYSGIKIKNMCHVQKKYSNPETTSDEMNQQIFAKLLQGAPKSELARMKNRYRSDIILTTQNNDNKEFYEMLFSENEYLKQFVPLMKKYLDEDETIKSKFENKLKKKY